MEDFVSGSKSQLVVTKTYENLCEEVVRRLLLLVESKTAGKGRFTIAVSGGLTPRGVYSLMASDRYCNRFPWEKIHFFWVDERWVSPEDLESNYGMTVDSLLTKIDIPVQNIH